VSFPFEQWEVIDPETRELRAVRRDCYGRGIGWWRRYDRDPSVWRAPWIAFRARLLRPLVFFRADRKVGPRRFVRRGCVRRRVREGRVVWPVAVVERLIRSTPAVVPDWRPAEVLPEDHFA
jgi:hypothetical protein